MYTPRYDEKANALFFAEASVDLSEIPTGGYSVFVCGSLQNPQKMAELIGREAPFAPAVVFGFRHENLEIGGRSIPFMLPAPEAPERVLTGIAWLALSMEELDRIASVELADNFRQKILLTSHLGSKELQIISFTRR